MDIANACTALSNSRNHLVHGHWQPEFHLPDIATGKGAAFKWARTYKTGNPETDATKLALRVGKKGQNRYDMERIAGKIDQTASLAGRVNEFRQVLREKLKPLVKRPLPLAPR